MDCYDVSKFSSTVHCGNLPMVVRYLVFSVMYVVRCIEIPSVFVSWKGYFLLDCGFYVKVFILLDN